MKITAWTMPLVAALLITACSSDDDTVDSARPSDTVTDVATLAPGGSPTVNAANNEVLVQGFRFQPAALTISTGTEVRWLNEDDIRHTATSGIPGEITPQFMIDLDGQGTDGSFVFTAAGTYEYFCEVHESMRGTVVVTE